jgi:sugar transferase (PEP-CTERM/EpsH1 system associated)
MRVLYIAHRIPYPPDKGDKIRSFHQIRCLSEKHTIHLACLVDDAHDLQHVKTLEGKYCASVDAVYRGGAAAKFLAGAALLTGRPLSVASFYSRELQEKINRRLQSNTFDAIIVFSSAMAAYVRHVSGVLRIMDFVDVDSEKWRLYASYQPVPLSWVYALEGRRLAKYEEEVGVAFDHSIFVTEMEAGLFRQRVPHRPISVIPNGVDLEYFVRDQSSPAPWDVPTVVFVGAMDYFPNVDAATFFCRDVFPLLRKAVPEIRFFIVGRNPAEAVRRLAREPGVTVTGSVPDVRPFLAQAGVAVAPFRIARGIQNKILEAMAMEVPVVATSTAVQGFAASGPSGVRVADDPQQFADEVLALIKNPVLWRKCAEQGRQYVERHHRWEDHGAQLESLLVYCV